MGEDTAIKALPFLVSYKEVLKREVEKLYKDISFFQEPFKQEVIGFYEGKKKELEELGYLLKHYRDGF